MLARRCITDRPLFIIHRHRLSITNRLRCITVPVGMLDTMMGHVSLTNMAIIAADVGMGTATMTTMTTIDRRPL